MAAIGLDHFIDRYLGKDQQISILKMDIEGAEELVLLTARQSLRRVDCMVIEIHPGLCDESMVRKILQDEFEYIYELSTPSTEFPVILASRVPVLSLKP